MSATVITVKSLVSLCANCVHRSGSFDYCAAHMGDVQEVGRGAERKQIVLTCTGYHEERKAAAQVVKGEAR